MIDPAAPLSVVVLASTAPVRARLRQALAADCTIAITGEAAPWQAAAVVADRRPDLLMVDLGDLARGIGAIQDVMGSQPTPILALLPEADPVAAAAALAAGAIEAMVRPDAADAAALRRFRVRLRALSTRRSAADGTAAEPDPPCTPPVRVRARAPLEIPKIRAAREAEVPVVGIVASTGGPQAVGRVLSDLEGLDACVLVVQHINADFVDGLLSLLRSRSALPVALAEDGARLTARQVLVAPAGRHLLLGPGRRAVLTEEPIRLHRPSASLLLSSLAEHAGPAAIGVVLTGMGDDGAAGLLAISARGGLTLAQDESSCAVYGMPQAAFECGAVSRAHPLEAIGPAIRRAVARLRR